MNTAQQHLRPEGVVSISPQVPGHVDWGMVARGSSEVPRAVPYQGS